MFIYLNYLTIKVRKIHITKSSVKLDNILSYNKYIKKERITKIKTMNAVKMSPNTLFNLACDVVDSLEQILSTSLLLTPDEIYEKLEDNLGYSLTHIRDIFKLATNISLTKYIWRRKYTNILLQIPIKEFQKLTMYVEVFGIQKFKYKCLREFPSISEKYSSEHMHLPIDKSLLKDLLDVQINERGKSYLMKTLYKDIVKNRIPYDIKSNTKKITIQNSQDILIDLEKTYFTFKDIVFKITATHTIGERKIEDHFLYKFLEKQPYISYSIDVIADANIIVRMLHQFLTGKTTATNGFSISLNWEYRHGWGNANLFSSISINDSKLQEVNFIDKPFLLFENQNVIIDLSFFDKDNGRIQHK